MGKTILLVKLAGDFKDCKWIYRFRANPGMPRGGVLPPSPVLTPGSALESRPRVALSSAQAPPVYSGPSAPGNSRLGRCCSRAVRGLSSRLGGGQFPLPLGPDRLLPTGQLVRGRDVTDRAVQPNRVEVPHELGHQAPSIFQAQGCLDSDAFSFLRRSTAGLAS